MPRPAAGSRLAGSRPGGTAAPRDSSAVASSSSWSAAVSCRSGERRQLTAAAAAASGDRRSWLTAASRAARIRSASAIGPAAPAVAAARAPCSLRRATRWARKPATAAARNASTSAVTGARVNRSAMTAMLSHANPLNSRARRGLRTCLRGVLRGHRDGGGVHVGAFAYGPFELRCGLASASRSKGRVAPVKSLARAVRGQAGSRSEPSAPGLRVALGRLAGGGWWCPAGRP